MHELGKHRRRVLVMIGLLVFASACGPRLRPAALGTFEPGADPDAVWVRLLSRSVDERGRIDFAGLAKDSRDLDAYAAWVARTSPETSPARLGAPKAALAFYLNAYNALAMYNAVHSGNRPEQQVRFFFLTQLDLGLEPISLYALENGIIRPLGEPRVHFALNCMVRGCPRLSREPYSADQLERQLERDARLFLNEDRNVEVLPWQRRVRLSSILKWYEKDFLLQERSLLAYVNRYREVPIPDSYEIQFIPYDWTLNEQ